MSFPSLIAPLCPMSSIINRPLFPCCSLCLTLVLVIGCGSSQEKNLPKKEASSKGTAATEAGHMEENQQADDSVQGPFVLGDMIDPFEVPTLEELEATTEWIDSPVRDSMVLLREQKKSEPALVTVEEAISLRNDSEEANEKILSTLSVVAPENDEGVDFNATINRALPQDLRAINPLLTSSVSEAQIGGLTGFGLFGFDWNMTPFASHDAVVSWQTSKDRMFDKVVMRDDMTWSDGKPITAHDVAFSFQVIMSSAVPVPAMRSGTVELKWVEAYDDHTLVFFHKKPLATNVWNVNFSVIPKHIYADSIGEDPTLRKSKHHVKIERNPVVGGAYEIIKRKRGQEIVLRRRDSYYMHEGKQVRDKPYFKKIRFKILEDLNTSLLALKSGDIDEGGLGAEQWLTQTNDNKFYKANTKVRGKEWTFFFVGWNLESPLFEDPQVRKALAYAMDYDEMLEDLCFGLYQQCYGISHPDAWMYPKNPPPAFMFDLDKAEDLLDAAGWEDSDGDGIRDKEIDGRLVPFEFSLIVSNKPDRVAICNLFRENLESIGITCNVSPLEAAVLQERNFKKNFQATMSGWGAGADPYTGKNIFGTGQDRNYGGYSNPEVDRLYDEGEKEFDREKRAEIYGEISNRIYEDQPYLFLYTRSSFYAFNKRLRGYRFSPRGPFSYSPGFGAIWAPSAE